MEIHILDVAGARLHYEIRGTGPLLLLMGSPMGAAAFAPLAEALAADRTVVTHDPRGISRSALADPAQDSTPQLRADDVAALLDALGAESVDVFGSSGGAVTALALAQRHPGRIRTLVAHEPPLLVLLPDAAERLAQVDDIVAAFHRDGLAAAWQKFMAASGIDPDGNGGAAPAQEPSAQDLVDGARFFAHELRATSAYRPDIEAVRAGAARVVVGIGRDSRGLETYRTSLALARALGVEPVEFPGEHDGFLAWPESFAETLTGALAGAGQRR